MPQAMRVRPATTAMTASGRIGSPDTTKIVIIVRSPMMHTVGMTVTAAEAVAELGEDRVAAAARPTQSCGQVGEVRGERRGGAVAGGRGYAVVGHGRLVSSAVTAVEN